MLVCVRVDSCFTYCRSFFFKQKTAYEMRISDCSSDVCSSDLRSTDRTGRLRQGRAVPCIRSGVEHHRRQPSRRWWHVGRHPGTALSKPCTFRPCKRSEAITCATRPSGVAGLRRRCATRPQPLGKQHESTPKDDTPTTQN